MTSSLTCVSTASDDDYAIANVSAAVSPVVSIGASPSAIICQGNNITFTASAVNAGSSPVYTWTVNGIPSGINDSIFSSASLNNNDLVLVIVNSSLSCAPVVSDSDSIVVSVSGNVAPSVSINSIGIALCENDTIQFIASAVNGGPLPTYQWMINGTPSVITNDTILLTTLQNGDTVSATVTSSLACVSPSSISSTPVIVSLQPKADPQIHISVLPSDTVCIGQPVLLQATISNGGSTPSVQWYVNSILDSNKTTTLSSSSFVQGDIIVANMSSNANCLLKSGDTSNFVRIVYHRPLSIQVSSSPPDCPGKPATVTAIVSGGNGGPYHLIWSNGSTDIDSIVLNAGRNTQVLVQAEDNCTTKPANATYDIPVLTGPVADFAYQNPSPGSFLNTVQFINLSKDFDTWTWYFSDSTSTNADLNPLHQFPFQGTYDVKLVTINNDGCKDSITYHVSVQEEIAVFYPNTFSPNGDGRNDFFQPVGASLQDYELTIWNRWGEMIYEGNSKMPWDGKVKGTSKPAPVGVYVFRIDLKEDYFEKKVVTGKVTLVR
jgi:gliding motility-associated-like protein